MSLRIEDEGLLRLTDPNTSKVREFTFDRAYWSHDGYGVKEGSGYMYPLEGSHYADQDMVMKDFGVPLIDNAFEGYNVCMFAYG